MKVDPARIERINSHVNRQRLVETARRLIDVPSPTGQAAAVSDRLAEILTADGFQVDRPDGRISTIPGRRDPPRQRPAGANASSSTVTLIRSICRLCDPISARAA